MTKSVLSDLDVGPGGLLTADRGLSRYTRWVHAGHSYGALHAQPGQAPGTYGYTSGAVSTVGASLVDRQWSALVRDALGLSDDSIWLNSAPVAAASDLTTMQVVTQESFIQSISYLPSAALTGANTNTRELRLALPARFGGPVHARVIFNSGTNLVSGVPFVIASMLNAGGGAPPQFAGGGGAATEWFNLHLAPGHPLQFISLHIGTGLADPGGLVFIKLASSYWNIAVSASKLAQDGLYQGGFATLYGGAPMPRWPGVPVSIAVAASASATSITVDALLGDIPSGSTLAFSNGVTATTTSATASLASTIAVSALSGAIAKGETAYHKPPAVSGSQGTYEGQGAIGGLTTFCWGCNEQTAQRESWRQAVHAVSTYMRCPGRRPILDQGGALRNHWQLTAGNGAAAAWAAVIPTAPAYDGLGGYVKFTGAVGGTKPTAVRKIEPSFEGGSYAIGFLALVGTSLGASATITVDGATPPQGVVTIKTTTIGTGLGTVIPMVKILTGLSAGAHTITVTVDTIDNTGGTAQFLIHWDGALATNPENELRWLNVARTPAGTMSDTNVALFNTDLADVLAGTATPPTGNTAEPGHGTHVKVVDIDTPLAKTHFDGGGVHPNDRGHMLVADAVFRSSLDVTKQPALAR